MPELDTSGPFTEYLTRPAFNPQQAPASGYEGMGSFVANLATNFLKGASKARAQKFAEQEMGRHRNLDAVTSAMQLVQQSQLPDERKQQLMGSLTQPLIGLMAGDKPPDKKSGVWGFVQSMFQNAIGGPLPKNVDPMAIGMGAVGDAIKALSTEKTAPVLREEADAAAVKTITDTATRLGGWQSASQQAILQDPQVQTALQAVYKHNGGKATPGVATLMETYFPAYRPGTPEAIRAEVFGYGGGSPQPATPPAGSSGSPSQPPPPPAAGAEQLSVGNLPLRGGMPTAAPQPPSPPQAGPAQQVTMISTPAGSVPRTTLRTQAEEGALDQRGRQRGRMVDMKTGATVNVDYSPRYGYVYGDTDTPINAEHSKLAWQPATAALPFASVYNAQNRYQVRPDASGALFRIRSDGEAEPILTADGKPLKTDTARGRLLITQDSIDDRFYESERWKLASHLDSLVAERQRLSMSAARLPTKSARDQEQAKVAALDTRITEAETALGVFDRMHPPENRSGGGAPPNKAPQRTTVTLTPEVLNQIRSATSMIGNVITGKVKPNIAPTAKPPQSAGANFGNNAYNQR